MGFAQKNSEILIVCADPTKVERPHYNEFVTDLQFIAESSDAQVNLLKSLLATTWLLRPEVQTILPNSLSNTQFVQKLESTAGVTLANESTTTSTTIDPAPVWTHTRLKT